MSNFHSWPYFIFSTSLLSNYFNHQNHTDESNCPEWHGLQIIWAYELIQSFPFHKGVGTPREKRERNLKSWDVWKFTALCYRLALWGIWWRLETGSCPVHLSPWIPVVWENLALMVWASIKRPRSLTRLISTYFVYNNLEPHSICLLSGHLFQLPHHGELHLHFSFLL